MSRIKTVKEDEKEEEQDKKEHGKDDSFYKNKWFFAFIIVGVLLFTSIFTGGFGTQSGTSTSNLPITGNALVDSVQDPQPSGNQKVSGGDYIMGSLEAKVTIIEYGDFECPFCKKFHDTTLDNINKNYIEKGFVKYVYRDFPLPKHSDAQKAAEASECAGEQGKFWEMHDKLFDNQGNLGADNLKQLAAEIDLEVGAFEECLDSDRYAVEVINDANKGYSAGVMSTPTFFINDQKVIGAQSYIMFSRIIDAAIADSLAPDEEDIENLPRIDINIQDEPTRGNSDTPITVVVFSDFECPYCANLNMYVVYQIQRDYVDTGEVKLIFRNFPLDEHEFAQKAAEAVECAYEQDMFWEMHDKLFENQNSLGVNELKQYAVDLGLNTEQFNSCLDSGKYASEVENDVQEGQSYGVSGTPTIFINGIAIVGQHSYSKFRQIIEDELFRLNEENGEN